MYLIWIYTIYILNKRLIGKWLEIVILIISIMSTSSFRSKWKYEIAQEFVYNLALILLHVQTFL